MLYPLYNFYLNSNLTLDEVMDHFTKHFYLKKHGSNKTDKVISKVKNSQKMQSLFEEGRRKGIAPNHIDFASCINSMMWFMFQSNETQALAVMASAKTWNERINQVLHIKEPEELREDTLKIFKKFSIYEEMTQGEYDEMTHPLSYWESYKSQSPSKAKDIVLVTGINIDSLNDADAKEIVLSIGRWAQNTDTPISQLKKKCIKDLLALGGESIFDAALERNNSEVIKEAQSFDIKQDHTICRFINDAIVEYKKEKETASIENYFQSKLGIRDEEMDNIRETVNGLAPDLSKNNHIENRLFKLACNCADRLSDEFKKLSDMGRDEALFFFSTIIVDLGVIQNDLDLDIMEERYKLLMCDEIAFDYDADDTFKFLNVRKKFFEDEYRRVKEEPMYTPMFLYNVFYLNPGTETPKELKSFTESPITLLKLQAKLYELESYIKSDKEKLM